jgi:polyhydroxyalkanoate synthase subunit PhaE
MPSSASWIDAAEEAYAEIALSSGFRKVYGELVNAQMRVRAGIQREVELIGGLFGMPGRTEVDAAHRKIAELERQLRRLRDAAPVQPVQTKSVPSRPAPVKVDKVVASGKPKPATKPVLKPTVKASPAAKKVAVKKIAATKAKPSRATAKTAVKRAPRQAIAAIAMPEPLKPMSVAKTAKRKR